MEISRQTALEVLGLSDNFTEQELNQNFRRLCKLVHPDTGGDGNLFKFIMCCKETLKNNNNTQQTKNKDQSQETRNSYKKEKKVADCTLSTLYDIWYDLGRYTKEYNIRDVIATAIIYIVPQKDKKQCKRMEIEVRQPFSQFSYYGFANFSKTITMPEEFRKFKKFNIRVEFMGETFKFKLSMKQPHYIVKHETYRFNSLIEFNFE